MNKATYINKQTMKPNNIIFFKQWLIRNGIKDLFYNNYDKAFHPYGFRRHYGQSKPQIEDNLRIVGINDVFVFPFLWEKTEQGYKFWQKKKCEFDEIMLNANQI